jgi:uncharacterized membrane protein YgaE (UPF0421/DUF939 family)
MEPVVPPPNKRAGIASPTMIYVIVGIIVATFVLFLVFRPR